MIALVRCFLILKTISAFTTGWVIPRNSEVASSSNSRLFAVTDSEEPDSRRRAFLLISAGSPFIATATNVPAACAADPDPFAAMDAISQNIGSSHSNYPNSISPLPTLKETEKDLVAGDEEEKERTQLDMDEALKNVRKEKQINPRSHG